MSQDYHRKPPKDIKAYNFHTCIKIKPFPGPPSSQVRYQIRFVANLECEYHLFVDKYQKGESNLRICETMSKFAEYQGPSAAQCSSEEIRLNKCSSFNLLHCISHQFLPYMFFVKPWKIFNISAMHAFNTADAEKYSASFQQCLRQIFPQAICGYKKIVFLNKQTSYLYFWSYESDPEEQQYAVKEPPRVVEAIFSLNTIVTNRDEAEADMLVAEKPKRPSLIEDVGGSPRLLFLRGSSKDGQNLFTKWVSSIFDCIVNIRIISPAELHEIAIQMLLMSLELNRYGEGNSLKKALQRSIEFSLSVPSSLGVSGLKTVNLSFTRSELADMHDKVVDTFKIHRIRRSSGDVGQPGPSDETVGNTVMKMILSHASNLLKIDLSMLNIQKFACPVGVVSTGGNFRMLRNPHDLFLLIHRILGPDQDAMQT